MKRSERLMLWWCLDRMDNPADPATWTIDGRLLTAEERQALLGFTLEDALDAASLMRLDGELTDAVSDVQWGEDS